MKDKIIEVLDNVYQIGFEGITDQSLPLQQEEAEKERCQRTMQHYTETRYVGEGKRLIEAFEIAAGLEPPTK